MRYFTYTGYTGYTGNSNLLSLEGTILKIIQDTIVNIGLWEELI